MIINRCWLTLHDRVLLKSRLFQPNVCCLPFSCCPCNSVLFVLSVQEEEDGSEDDGDTKTQVNVSVRAEFGVFSFMDPMDEEVEGFISPVDELSPSKTSTDMGLSNLHSASMWVQRQRDALLAYCRRKSQHFTLHFLFFFTLCCFTHFAFSISGWTLTSSDVENGKKNATTSSF